jgi:hypothetical protein
MNDSKWCSQGSGKWLQVDLGASHAVSAFVIKNAGLGGENTGWNTRDYNLQLSPDGTNWTTPVVSVTGNRSSRTLHAISPTRARYVRLNVLAPTYDGSGVARIYELEVYSHESETGDIYLPMITR